jgi:hypothetical protein
MPDRPRREDHRPGTLLYGASHPGVVGGRFITREHTPGHPGGKPELDLSDIAHRLASIHKRLEEVQVFVASQRKRRP